jgi:hypothetical protein
VFATHHLLAQSGNEPNNKEKLELLQTLLVTKLTINQDTSASPKGDVLALRGACMFINVPLLMGFSNEGAKLRTNLRLPARGTDPRLSIVIFVKRIAENGEYYFAGQRAKTTQDTIQFLKIVPVDSSGKELAPIEDFPQTIDVVRRIGFTQSNDSGQQQMIGPSTMILRETIPLTYLKSVPRDCELKVYLKFFKSEEDAKSNSTPLGTVFSPTIVIPWKDLSLFETGVPQWIMDASTPTPAPSLIPLVTPLPQTPSK